MNLSKRQLPPRLPAFPRDAWIPFIRCRVLVTLGMVSLGTLPALSGEAAYLPAVGPAPIRFALPPIPSATLTEVVLPPMEKTVSTSETAPPPSPAASPTPAAQMPNLGPPPPGESNPPGTPGGQAPLAQKPEDIPLSPFILPVPIDPQLPSAPLWQNDPGSSQLIAPDLRLLMRFFGSRSLSNDIGAALVMPVPFIPPAPRPPSSSASFETTPASKP